MAAMEITGAPLLSEQIEPENAEPTVTYGGDNALKDGDGVEFSSGKRERDQEEDEDEGGDEGAKRQLYWKTSLCSFFRRRPGLAGCSHGDACRYAHSEAELRPRPDNTWDPTSERAKKMAGAENDEKSESLTKDDHPVTVDATSLDKCLIGISRRWATDNLKSFLDGQGILYKTAKKKKGMTVGFVSFDNTEQLIKAIEVLKENSTCGKPIKVADAISRSCEKKSVMQKPSNQMKEKLANTEVCTDDPNTLASSSLLEADDAIDKETSAVEGLVSTTRTAREVVTPLAEMPYGDQLDQKKCSLTQMLKKLTRNARKACPASVTLPEWIIKSKEIGGLPCKLEGILESPLINGYRNKCEFSVGYSLQGKPTVGFMIGSFREGITAIEEPINCPNVSRISSKYALIFQEFLQSSVLPIWNRMENKGFWRQFTVREGRKPSPIASIGHVENEVAEVMLIIQVCSTDVDEEVMKNEFQRLLRALEHEAAACSPSLPLTAIVVQDYKGISNAAPADCPLIPLMLPEMEGQSHSENKDATEARIHDYISNLRFSISPTAFFQVNTLAAERLYSLAGDWADLNSDTLLFDICCGTGTIGLTLAHRVGMVVGIEMNASAVSDAERNAKINGITNCRFVCSKAEDIMGALLKEYLDIPEQHGIVSDVAGSSSTVKVSEMLSCSEGSTIENLELVVVSTESHDGIACKEDCVKEKLNVDSMAVDGPDKDLNDTLGTVGNCKAACTNITKDNGVCKDLIQDTCASESKGEASMHQFKNVVAIVDPPRVGLHPVVIKALRTHPRIRRLIYISCNPESLVANAIELCTPTADEPDKGKGNRGWRKMSSAGLARHRTKSMPKSEPFQPVRAMAVDMFPHTQHCEMVMLLER
ncbi:zinc finger CCCH domain-containing protein 24 isoform X1 [Canna indica]|uniref:Zinc finger CCCH domain-containing protein 24 isoform X1 n=1 Tax=Canna indica TaxID=4628 RepID=A0AAQ3QQI1_9LILI|nr:zinc finger CCCH domain-containing protein 24 isoform X1 [Canna indica]